MTWFIEPLEIADSHGNGTGRFRMTAWSDEGGGGPIGDLSHDHANKEEALECERCDDYCSRIAGFPSRREQDALYEAEEKAEYERLKAKFDPPPPPPPRILTLEEQFKQLVAKYQKATMTELPHGNLLVTLPDWQLPDGYDRKTCDVFFIVPAGYPHVAPERFFTSKLCLSDGRTPYYMRSVSVDERRHFTGGASRLPNDAHIWFWKVQSWDWRRDTLKTYASVIKSRLDKPTAGLSIWEQA